MIRVQQTEQSVCFSGELTRQAITTAFDEQYRQIVKNSAICLDLSQVTKVDTAGLAWLLLLIELAEKNGCEIKLVNLPKDLIKLAQLSGVSALITTN